MIDWPDKLIDSIARRRSVLFLGAGISANAQNRYENIQLRGKLF